MTTKNSTHPSAFLVTGASSGIGRATALLLDRSGFQVFAGVRRGEQGEALRRQASERLTPILLDVTDQHSIEAAARSVADKLGGRALAGLVNNAGIDIAGPLETSSIAEARSQFEVNVIGLLAVTQAFLPLLRQGRGRLVNMGSVLGRLAIPLMGAYSASKFALEGLTDALRIELRPWGILVSLIEPGPVATPLWSKTHLLAGMNEERGAAAGELYATANAAAHAAFTKFGQTGISPDRVAAKVFEALMASNPKPRYLVGRDAKALSWLASLVPDRIRDRILIKRFGLPQRLESA
ncbi:MAG TPA: SDR family oxidoreductase [Pyrinomonadaceae bacterium]|nr:SDR family oxidoreductase [Pyrinomonadaceae bacterium]